MSGMNSDAIPQHAHHSDSIQAGELRSPVEETLHRVLEQTRSCEPGVVADYIPELATADPGANGIALVSVRGRVYRAGDCDHEFTIQSISKAFVYAMAVDQLGLEEVHRHVGYEPSGEPFNAISMDARGRPQNPMINAGAIVTSALIPGADPEARFTAIRKVLSAFAGHPLGFSEGVFASEYATGHRNRALANLALATGVLPRSVDDAVTVYFQQCSLLVTAADLAVMGATLANDGRNPVTGEQVVSPTAARHAMSVMNSCGMYDRSGQWQLEVGIPAKSGVGGGIVALKPGLFGVGVFSPPLDAAGNSARGVAALKLLSNDYGFHVLRHPDTPASPVAGIEVSGEHDEHVTIRLRGDLDFVATEQIVTDLRESLQRPQPPRHVTIDLSAVSRLRPVSATLLRLSAQRAAEIGIEFEIVDPSGLNG